MYKIHNLDDRDDQNYEENLGAIRPTVVRLRKLIKDI